MNPLTVGGGNDTLGTKNHSVGIVLNECLKCGGDLLCREFSSGFYAKALKDVVGVMMVMLVVVASAIAVLVVVVVVMVMMLVVVASAVAVLVVVVMVMMLVVVASAVAMLVVIVVVMLVVVASTIAVLIVIVLMVMLVVVASAVAVIVVIVMMVMLVVVASAVAVIVVIVMMVMLVVVASAIAMLIVIVMMMVMVVVVMLLLKCTDCIVEGILVLHCRKDVCAGKLIPGSRNYGSGSVVLSNESGSVLDSRLLCGVGMRKDNGGSVADLIAEELAKVLHIHLALTCVNNGGEATDLEVSALNALHRLDNVGELANARGLDENSVGIVLCEHLGKSLGKIANERAADTARVHLGDLDAGILKEAAVNADLAKLVLDKDELLAGVSLFYKLLDERGLTCAEEARKNINSCHSLFSILISHLSF